MRMYWTFNCFFRLFIYLPPLPTFLQTFFLWLSNLEFWRPKKKDQVARIGVRGGGFRCFGQCPKENVFFSVDVFPYTENINWTKLNQLQLFINHKPSKLDDKMKKPPGLFLWKTLFRLLGRQSAVNSNVKKGQRAEVFVNDTLDVCSSLFREIIRTEY